MLLGARMDVHGVANQYGSFETMSLHKLLNIIGHSQVIVYRVMR